MVESIVSSALIWFVGLLVGAVGIAAGAKLLLDRDTGFRRAILTALIGATVWALVSYFIGGIPLIGPILMLIIWIGVINWIYPGGWGTAAGIGLVAWLVAVGILFALSTVGVVTPDALGIPGV
ncbi:hypothetical protein [Halopelagius longus]|uniref:Phage holin family protein n=1 Tax=Halopelagius longus TaxID=1236180 RepID=A0A1H1DIK3_9EURY|nr:hypothetical protein [Halopelagius longus]RDI71339.1 hypothetical protein DWB78_06125 [Halopelagius longus]SDQ76059.1 hypothetical protein SAMN05216278_2423 [Halopelagius longus]